MTIVISYLSKTEYLILAKDNSWLRLEFAANNLPLVKTFRSDTTASGYIFGVSKEIARKARDPRLDLSLHGDVDWAVLESLPFHKDLMVYDLHFRYTSKQRRYPIELHIDSNSMTGIARFRGGQEPPKVLVNRQEVARYMQHLSDVGYTHTIGCDPVGGDRLQKIEPEF